MARSKGSGKAAITERDYDSPDGHYREQQRSYLKARKTFQFHKHRHYDEEGES
jgi:hypothetical protein